MIIGIIGGSGLYQLKDSKQAEPIEVSTPYGSPSGRIFKTTSSLNTLLFIARHGEGHTLSPSEVNYRANIFALKKLGARAVISISAVGSMKKEIVPSQFVLPNQYIDLTRGTRARTFFGDGVVAHAHFADPCCASLRSHVASLLTELGTKAQVGGTYVCIEGPQFSTRAESHLYRSWKLPTGSIDVIGMTALPEARLAREAGLCYQTIAMATDYDCWNEETEAVSLDAILQVLSKNVSASQNLVARVLSSTFPDCRSHCHDLMKNAVMTSKTLWPENRREALKVLLDE